MKKIALLAAFIIMGCSSGTNNYPPPDAIGDTGLCNPPCTGGQTCCVNVCADLQTSPENCGSCGFHCGAGEFCEGGHCKTCGGATCAEGETCCSDSCVNTQTDELNCGGCGRVCAGDEQCTEGNCVGPGTCEDCNPPYKCCDGTWCINVTQDKENCGDCGVVCDPEMSDRCAGGACMCHAAAECTGDMKCCDDGCRDVTNDANNCGDCGLSCGEDQDCAGGRCRCGGQVCGFGEVCCPGAGCTNVWSDMNNCGECGKSCGDRADRCVEGECACGAFRECSMGFFIGECIVDIGAPPERCCSGRCEDMDEDNCQYCGHRCGAGEQCLSRMNFVTWECEPYCGVPD
jgi:hypothetical protein